jgi:TonB C terminal
MPGRRATVALAGSLVAHLALLFLLLSARPEQDHVPPPPTAVALEVELVEPARARPAGELAARAVAIANEAAPGKRRTGPPHGAPSLGSPPSEEAPALVAGPEARRLDLSTPQLGGGLESVDDPDGMAVRNEGRPDLELQAADTPRATEERIQGWMAQSQAEGHVRNGHVDPYFGRLASELHESLSQQAAEHRRELQPGLLAGWSKSAQLYGATGNPSESHTPPSRPDPPRASVLQALPYSIEGQGGGQVTGRSAIVEIRLHPDGGLQASLLIAGSGDPRFDRLVLASIPLALGRLPPPSLDGGFGIHDFGSRSRWSFEEQLSVAGDPISFLVPLVERALGADRPLTLEVRLLEVY